MSRLLFIVVQLALAALVGYWAGQHAQSNGVIATAPAPAPAPAPPPAPAPEPPKSAPAGAAAAANLSMGYRLAVERAAPSVVTVYSARTARVGPLGLGGRALLSQGLGSGVVINAHGHIVTNNHVVEGANELAVALPDGTLRPTKVLGVDPDSDLALLAVDPKGLRPIEIADMKSVAVGDVVLAVGNPLGVGQTVTQGIVSALGRHGIGINPVEDFIQTDAAINPGNSGGALIDTAGKLVGINSAILSRGGGSEGIGFAIPVDLAQRVIASLEKTGRVARGWLGVSTQATPAGQTGALVVAVQRRGPADRAGIAPGDAIVKLGDRSIDEPDDLVGAVLEMEPGTKVPVEVVRDGRHETLEVELGRRPPLRRPSSNG
ncbi:MAG TPA: trypsin-like peptidase domain-containing protein [Casimicrobiaceae bacterium]|jgi:S1-C subfamily serine protease